MEYEALLKLAIDYHKTIEGEYGCNGATCPGVKRLVTLLSQVTARVAAQLQAEKVTSQDHWNYYQEAKAEVVALSAKLEAAEQRNAVLEGEKKADEWSAHQAEHYCMAYLSSADTNRTLEAQLAAVTKEKDELSEEYEEARAERDQALSALVAKLKASDLPRFGIQWQGPHDPISVPMADGYWTPWHLAAASHGEVVTPRRLTALSVQDLERMKRDSHFDPLRARLRQMAIGLREQAEHINKYLSSPAQCSVEAAHRFVDEILKVTRCVVSESAHGEVVTPPVWDRDAFELQLNEDAERLLGNLQTGDGEHSESLDTGLIKASFRTLLKWAAAAPAHGEVVTACPQCGRKP